MKDNELIARFMGGEFKLVPPAFGQDGFIVYQFEKGNNPNPLADIGTQKRVSQLDYHKRWDWLMPVVEKIHRLEDGVTIRGVTFTLKNSRAVIKDGKKTFSCHTISPLNSTYRVVVEFIKWYNDQPK